MSNLAKYQELNEEQLAAVQQVEGPVLVFAGAGTGKTKTLTSRISYMVEECQIDPEKILAITFTKKAANEMKERIRKSIGVVANRIAIMTIHAFCAKVLRKTISAIGFSSDFDIIDEDDSLKIIGDCYKDLNIDRKHLAPRVSQSAISAYKNAMIKKLNTPIDRIYTCYQNKLKKDNLVDFDDLLVYALQVISDHPEICRYFQEQYQYLLVDEFQDTNVIQYELLKRLGSKYRNLFVVGDDDQSIYSFRGACVENMMSFVKDFKDCHVFKLLTNYRSSNALLRGANNVIKNNRNREIKTLVGVSEGKVSDVIINEAYYYEDEVRYVVNEIKALLKDGYCHEDIAILYRNNIIARHFELAFIENRVPYRIFGGFSYLKRKEVKDLIAYLKFIVDPNSLVHFKRIVNTPTRGIGDKTIEKLEELITENGLSLFSAIDYLNESAPSSKTNALFAFKQVIIELQSVIDTLTLSEFFDVMIDKTGYSDYIMAENDVENNRLGNVKEFKSILYTISEQDHANQTNVELLKNSFDELLLDDTLATNDKGKGITLSTIHSAKGLEFDVVFVVALEEGIFPAARDESDIEEERRVAYVAFTRAKMRIYLSCAARRLIYGRLVSNQKSRFLTEYLTTIDKDTNTKNSETNKSVNDLQIGDMISHTNFGEGHIISIGSDTIQVLFVKDSSLRTLMKSHSAIKPL